MHKTVLFSFLVFAGLAAHSKTIECTRNRMNPETLEVKFNAQNFLTAFLIKNDTRTLLAETVECRVSKQNDLVFVCRDNKRGIEIHSHVIRRDFMAYLGQGLEHAHSEVVKFSLSKPDKDRPRQKYEYQRQYNVLRCDVTSD